MGFIRISRHYRSCILQIHARGIPVRNNGTLFLYAFFCEHEQIIFSQIAKLEPCVRNISVRLSVTETCFPDSRPLRQIDGFFLGFPDNSRKIFWMASDFFFDIRPDMFSAPPADTPQTAVPEPPDDTPHTALPEPPDDTPQTAVPELPDDTPQTAVPEPPDDTPHTVLPEPQADAPQEVSAPECPEVPPKTPETPALETAETKNLPHAKKITRTDISLLPKKFWPLASNSFLLHGYHNYNHLALIEENGRRWLGVPGIYDTREARAADLFGFPRFTRAYVSVLDLNSEERNDTADFGHWCRCVGVI